jgi:hypothetical protein
MAERGNLHDSKKTLGILVIVTFEVVQIGLARQGTIVHPCDLLQASVLFPCYF